MIINKFANNARLKGFTERFRKNYWISLFFILIQSIIIYKFNYIVAFDNFGNEYIYIAFGLVGASLSVSTYSFIIQCITSIWGGVFSKVLSWIFTFIVVILTISELFLLNKYNSPITTTILSALFSTNGKESIEFIKSLEISIIYKEIILMIIFFLFSYFVFRKYRIKRFLFAIMAFSQLFCSVLFVGKFLIAQVQEYQSGVCRYWIMSSFDRPVFSYMMYSRDLHFMESIVNGLNNPDFKNISYDPQEIDDINIVIVLGESLRRNSMHCYGANMPNTPNIDSLISSGDIILFKDVVCSACNTNPSVSQTFTFYDNIENNKKSYLEYPSIFKALKKAGYYTYWASNQEKRGLFVNNVFAIACSCDSLRYTRNINSADAAGLKPKMYDEDVLPIMLKRQDVDKSKFATVIHLMGSHEDYKFRYTQNFDRFAMPNKAMDKDKEEKTKMALQYSNSILYNDYIIKKIIDFYKDTPSIVFYFSDHGLDLFDNPQHPDVAGHATSIYAAPIPFMVYISPEIRKRSGIYKSIVRRIESAKDKPISLDMFCNSLANLLGIHTEYDSDYTQCFSDTYIPPKQRTVTGFNNNITIDAIHTEPDNWEYSIKQ